VRQGEVGTALFQLTLGKPHLVDRLFEDGAGLGIEAGGLGVVVRMAELGQHVLGAAEGRAAAGGGAVVVAVAVGMRGAVAGRQFGRALVSPPRNWE
jgi:hypothetical protein